MAAMLELDDPYTGWTSHDYRLQEAVASLDRDICGQCGNPTWLCHTSLNEVDFEIHSSWCYAKAELEDYDNDPSTMKLEAGEYRYAVAVGVPTGVKDADGKILRDPLPTRRAALEKLADVPRT